MSENCLKKKSYTEIILIGLLCLQAVFIIYTNLFGIPETMDNDTAKLFVHAIEMWRNKTAFIPSWINQTTLEIDCPLFLAVFIYGITGNIYISFGIADIVLTVLLLYTVYRILKRLNIKNEVILFTFLLILIPYSFGQLLYYNMTFFSGGQYLVKTLVPLLLIDLISDDISGKIRYNLTGILLYFLCFICAVSSSLYVFLTGIMPVFACYIWCGFFNKEKIKENLLRRQTILCFFVTAFSAAGVLVSHINHVGSSTQDTTLISVKNAITGLLNIPGSWLELLGAFPYDTMPFLSLTAISYVMRAFLALLIISAVVCNIVKTIRSLKGAKEDMFVKAAFIVIILFNMIILWFTGRSGEARYFTCSVVIGLILAGSLYTCCDSNEDDKRADIIRPALILLVAVVAILSDIKVLKGDCYPGKTGDNLKLISLSGVIAGYPERTVFFLNDTDAAEMMRAFDHDSGRIYLAYKTDSDIYNESGVKANDYYADITDASRLDNDHLMIVNEYYGSTDLLPDYMKDLYTEADRFQNFAIYKASVNRMDGLSGYEYNDHSKDYCYSTGYTIYNGMITIDGRLSAVGNDDYVISSSYLGPYTGELDIRMHYSGMAEDGQPGETIGKLEVWDGDTHELIGSGEVTGDGTDSEFAIEGIKLRSQNPVMKLYLNGNCSIDIESFEYDKH